MMDDLISRRAALDVLVTSPNFHTTLTRIEELPAVDAVPVVHGRWTTERTLKHDGEWYCSVCEYEPIVFIVSNYCPNCGAIMDGDT